MNIVQIHTSYRHAGGEDRVVASEAELLRDAGHNVDQVQTANPSSVVGAAAALAAAPWNVRSASRVLSRLSSSPDLIHVHNTWFALGPAVIHRLHGLAPVVVTLHNYRISCASALLFRDGRPCTDCVGGFGWPGIRHACYRGSRLQTTAVVVTSASARYSGAWTHQVDRVLVHNPLAAEIAAAGGVPERLIQVADNFTDDPGPRIRPPSRSGEVLAVGRLSWEKGFDRLVRAWALSQTQLTLTIIGEGPERERLQAMAPPNVKLVGGMSRTEVKRMMLGARALMLPSRVYESQPLVLLEAMAAGLPAFATDHPPLQWVLKDSGPDSLIRDSPGSWEDAIRRSEQPSFVDDRSIDFRAIFEQRFSPVVAVRSLADSYENAVQTHGGHA